MTRVWPVVALLVLSGCVAETVERRKPRKGPVKEVGFVDLGGGHIRYSTDGWGWFVAGRRRDALRKMRRNCGKLLAPQILDEYLRQDTDISYAGEDVTTSMDKGIEHFKIAPFNHFVYECRPKPGSGVAEPPRVSTAAPRVILVVPPQAPASEPSVSTTTAVSTAAAVSPSADAGVISVPAVSTSAPPAQEPPK